MNAGYVYVAGIAPLDRRNETWNEFKKKYPGIEEVAMFGTLDNPIANSVANQARSVLPAHPDIKVMFAPYDEFAKGVKIAVDEAGLVNKHQDLFGRHFDLGYRRDARAGQRLGRDRRHQPGRRRPGLGARAGACCSPARIPATTSSCRRR